MSATAEGPKACPSCGGRYPADALFCPADGSPLSGSMSPSGTQQDPYLGREILGHIEIRQLAGVGAMGRVYRAFQKGIDRDVAVKILHRELSANQQLVTRFHREAKVASRLSHPNVVHVYLTGQLPDGALYIVMEFLDGLSLQSALAATGGAMPLPRALHIALQLCEAAGEAHAQGVVHRDIKPENVMLVRRAASDDYVKVLDFGIARLDWGEQSMATAAGLIFGTARYISPEGAQGDTVGPPSDVYSIATMLYQMLAGRTPFEGEQAVALLVQQIHDPPPPIRSVARAGYVPDPIADVIMRNLAKQPAARERDAQSLGRALLDAAKASGMSPEQLVLGRRSMPVDIASMQRTRQLQLDPALSARLSPPPEPSRPAPRTAYQAPRTEIGEDSAAPPGVATTKWVPPADFDARLRAAGETPAAPASAPVRQPPASSGVDKTLGDDSATPPPVLPPSASGRAGYEPRAEARTQESGPIAVARPPFESEPSRGGRPYDSAEDARAPRESAHGAVTKPPSGVDTTLADRAIPGAWRRRAGAAGLVVGCFLLGVGGAAAVAYKLGLVGASSATASLDTHVQRATDALTRHQYDAPPGENVRELTNEGLARWPGNPRLLRIRELASDDLVEEAREKLRAGDAASALRLARLGEELHPNEPRIRELVAECEKAESAALPPLTGLDAAPSAPTARVLPAAAVAIAVRATLDASPARPRLGQPVDLVARLLPTPPNARPKVEGAQFLVTGPRLGGGMPIRAVEEGGQFRASYTFLEAGRYEVVFAAKADAFAVRTTRSVQVLGEAVPVPTGPSATVTATVPPPLPTLPPAHGDGGWL